MFCSARPYAEELGIHGVPLVLYQGAWVRTLEGEEIYFRPLETRDARDVIDFMEDVDCHYQIYLHDELYMESLTAEAEKYARLSSARIHVVDDLRQCLQEAPLKMVAINYDEPALDEVERKMREHMGDRITVVAARTGSVLAARRCDDIAACRRPLAMPEAPAAPTNGFLHRVFAALGDQPDRYVSTLNRGATSLRDDVLVWEAGRLDVAPLLAARAEAVYDMTLTPVGCPSAVRCADAAVEARLVWLPRAPAASIELAQPGLFELSLRRAGQSAALPAERNWVLAVVRADEAAARERLRAATALTESWGAAVDADAKRGFIRAAMSIADR
jgi:hypothetical protein